MRLLKTLTFAGMAAMFAAPAYAYQRCKTFESAELKAMSTEGLEKAYCWNEDRLIEILEIVRSSGSEEAKHDRDACSETLIKLSAQPEFERHGGCPSAVQAGAGSRPEEAKRELARNLGIADEKDAAAR